MIRRPPRSTPLYSSAASDVYKRQLLGRRVWRPTCPHPCCRCRLYPLPGTPAVRWPRTIQIPPWIDQEVPPPLASTDPAATDGEGADEPPALPQVEATPDAVAPEATDAATQSTASWGDQAGTGDDPLASSSTGMASWAKPTLTYDYMACSLRPHWKCYG